MTTDAKDLSWATVLPLLREAGITTVTITAYDDSDERYADNPEWDGEIGAEGIDLPEAVIQWVEDQIDQASYNFGGIGMGGYGVFELDVEKGEIARIANAYMPAPELQIKHISPQKQERRSVLTKETTDA